MPRPSAASSSRGRIAAVRSRLWIPLVVLVAVGVALRIALSVLYKPAVVYFWDSAVYLYSARHGLFDDPARNAGYPLFLRAVHALSDSFWFTIGLQHLMGILAGLLLFATVRRLGGSRWVALVPAAFVILNGDLLLLEHSLLTESLFVFLLCAALYCTVRAANPAGEAAARRGPEPRLLWAAAAGVAFGALLSVRVFALSLAILAVAWLLLASPGPWRRRLLTAGSTGVVVLLCVFAYAGAHWHFVGEFSLSRTGGWSMYSRVASFADCSKFTPPAGTERLCEDTPPEQRTGGPRFYFWLPGSPAREAYGAPPAGDADLGRFGRAAALAQPGDYIETVWRDAWRYVEPSSVSAEGGPGDYTFVLHVAPPERAILETVSVWYDGSWARVDSDGEVPDAYQQVARMHGALVVIGLVLALAGLIGARTRMRLAILLLLSISLALYLVPVLTLTFNWRYGVPAAGVLAAAATLALQGLAERFRRREPEPAPPPGERPVRTEVPA